MSYDVIVYCARFASAEELLDVVDKGAGLCVGQQTDGALTILRGVRRRYSFTVDGPERVDAEDVPVEVGAVLLGARWMYSILVEGTVDSEIPHAIRFGRRLARVLDGAMLDQQTGALWSRSRSRRVERPEREERVSVLGVRWCCLREELRPDPTDLFVSTARRFLPEALPRRFGECEPLQGKLADEGADGFREAWRAAASMVSTLGTVPCVGGHLAAGAGGTHSGPFWSMSLSFLAGPFAGSGWRDQLRSLLTRLADGLPAFYAEARVSHNYIWSGRSLWSDGQTESRYSPVPAGQKWTGLPAVPGWLSWLGEPFAEYYSLLPPSRTTVTDGGVLYEASEGPGATAGITPLTDFLPIGLFSTGSGRRSHGAETLVPATEIPAMLRPNR